MPERAGRLRAGRSANRPNNYADDQVFVGEGIIGRIENSAGPPEIAACSGAFVRKRLVTVDVEVRTRSGPSCESKSSW